MFIMCEMKEDIDRGEAILLFTEECLSVSSKPVIHAVKDDLTVLLSVQIGEYNAVSLRIAFDSQYRDTLNNISNNYLRDVIKFIHCNYSIIKSIIVVYYRDSND